MTQTILVELLVREATVTIVRRLSSVVVVDGMVVDGVLVDGVLVDGVLVDGVLVDRVLADGVPEDGVLVGSLHVDE